MKDTYTKDEVIEIIREAYYQGINDGQVEYGDDAFNPEDYLNE